MTTSPDFNPAFAPFPATLSMHTPGMPPPLAFKVTPSGLSTEINTSPCTALMMFRLFILLRFVIISEEEEEKPLFLFVKVVVFSPR